MAVTTSGDSVKMERQEYSWLDKQPRRELLAFHEKRVLVCVCKKATTDSPFRGRVVVRARTCGSAVPLAAMAHLGTIMRTLLPAILLFFTVAVSSGQLVGIG